mmetsp:Transcript_33387/g.83243  ORF Transcript_33387/g.83243 Transcript_33387/m.83243 type:complete len:321 (+) Transcript_33387:24-986(+)
MIQKLRSCLAQGSAALVALARPAPPAAAAARHRRRSRLQSRGHSTWRRSLPLRSLAAMGVCARGGRQCPGCALAPGGRTAPWAQSAPRASPTFPARTAIALGARPACRRLAARSCDQSVSFCVWQRPPPPEWPSRSLPLLAHAACWCSPLNHRFRTRLRAIAKSASSASPPRKWKPLPPLSLLCFALHVSSSFPTERGPGPPLPLPVCSRIRGAWRRGAAARSGHIRAAFRGRTCRSRGRDSPSPCLASSWSSAAGSCARPSRRTFVQRAFARPTDGQASAYACVVSSRHGRASTHRSIGRSSRTRRRQTRPLDGAPLRR